MKEKEVLRWERLFLKKFFYDKQPFIRKRCRNARHLLRVLSSCPDWAWRSCGSWEISGERTDVELSRKWLQQMRECGRDSCLRSTFSCESAASRSTETLSSAWTLAPLSGRTYISSPMRVWWLYHMAKTEGRRTGERFSPSPFRHLIPLTIFYIYGGKVHPLRLHRFNTSHHTFQNNF